MPGVSDAMADSFAAVVGGNRWETRLMSEEVSIDRHQTFRSSLSCDEGK